MTVSVLLCGATRTVNGARYLYERLGNLMTYLCIEAAL
jgi:hypothetical protein